jgi:predicted DNA-binding transcriptional regulator AlpA
MTRREVTGRKPDTGANEPTPTPRLALSIPEFCEAHGFSEGMFYKMKKQGLTPREMKVGTRTLITFEAAADWRAERQAARVVEHKAQPAPLAKTVTPPTKPIAEVRRPRGRPTKCPAHR